MLTLSYYVQRVRELGLREASHQARDIFTQGTSRALTRICDRYFRSDPSEREILNLCGFSSPVEVLSHFRTRKTPAFFIADDFNSILRDFGAQFPSQREAILGEADRLMQHQVDLLGSGRIDLEAFKKKSNAAGYLPWHFDFKSAFGWNRSVYYRDIRYGNQPGVDVKVPWELSRFHHLIPLGQAYRLSSDERYAKEAMTQIADWIDENPVRYGVNWSSTMDVGIRAVNWIWALYFLKDSPSIGPGSLLKVLTSLYAHARYIRSNLEYREAWIGGSMRRLNSNHYLSNLIGLLYISVLFPEFRLDDDRRFSASELEIELFEETLPDGTDYEHSTSYHRLVFEIFLSGFFLLELNGQPMSGAVWERLERMAQFVGDYMRVDGTAPQIGDSDDGRLHPLSVRDHNDHRYLCFIEGTHDPEYYWWFGGKPPLRLKARQSSQAYAGSGFYVMRAHLAHVFISAATVGMHGLGSHSHNDQLSFEYSTSAGPWIVDPGSYIYTPDPAARNLFRSTAYHNTVCIDGLEINPIPEGQLFQLSDQARVNVFEWTVGAPRDVLDVEHTGYLRLNDPVCHRRRFELERTSGTLLIQDSFEGRGTHTLEWFFHVAPSIQIRRGASSFVLEKGNSTLEIEFRGSSIKGEIVSGWYSPSYGVRQSASIVVLRVSTGVPFRAEVRIVPARVS
jgi:Heparinase II/III-like protein/Heparinase II/III N-terminus